MKMERHRFVVEENFDGLDCLNIRLKQLGEDVVSVTPINFFEFDGYGNKNYYTGYSIVYKQYVLLK